MSRRFVIFVGPIEFVSPTDADSTLRRSVAVANAQSDSVMVSAREREWSVKADCCLFRRWTGRTRF